MFAHMTRRSLLAGSAGVALFGSAQPSAPQALPRIVVTKDPSCGCCAGWVEHLLASGFAAGVVESAELNRVKARLGVPQELASCHTAEVGGYVVEGHVPADAIKRLLAEKPA